MRYLVAIAVPALLGASGIPPSFEPNRGASGPQVRYLARTPAYSLLLAPSEAILRLPGANAPIRMRLAGANPSPRLEALDPLPAVTRYYLGKDPRRWSPDVPRYRRVLYRQVYPGIDLVYYGKGDRLEFDFLVGPGADPRRIQLDFSGPVSLRTDPAGDLVLAAAAGEFRQHRPRIYQDAARGRVEIAGRYVIHGRRVSLELDPYEAAKPLVIDPEMSFATYLGGAGLDRVWDVAVDAAGDVYLVGETASATLALPGLPSPSYSGGTDAFVARLRPDGKSLVYLTYFGGASDDRGYAIAVDAAGNAYVTGETRSAGFPVTPGALQTSYGGGETDAFLVKLDPSGRLAYATFLGGRSSDGGNGLVLDAAGNPILAGYTGSSDFPVTAGAARSSYGGGNEDAFVSKLNPSASGPAALVFSTFLGGSGLDSAYGIALGPGGAAYITGSTDSRDFPATDTAYQRRNLSLLGTADVFVTRVSADGARIEYSTYFGAEGDEVGSGIAVGPGGDVYFTGTTNSSLLMPAGLRPFQPRLGGGADAFVARLNPARQGTAALVWATYLGGRLNEDASRIVVDSAGNACVVGGTESPDFPTAGNPLQSAFSGTQPRDDDAFLTRFDASGAPVYSTFLGARGVNHAWGVALDSAGNAYVVGSTSSAGFPVTAGALQSAYGGSNFDGFAARINFSEAAPEPRITAGGVVNAASFAGGSVSPGEIVTLFGSQIGPAALAGLRLTASNRVDTALAGARVLFDGQAAPLIYVSANQASAIVPYSVAGKSTTQVQVEYQGVRSPAVTLPVAASAPGLFTLDSSGRGPGAILNQDFTVNSASNPAAIGSAVILFATGEGQTNPPGEDGRLAAEPLPAPLLPVSVAIGGRPAAVLYAGGAPGLVAGVLQVNVRVPDGVTPGPAVPVVLTVGNNSAQSGVTLAVR